MEIFVNNNKELSNNQFWRTWNSCLVGSFQETQVVPFFFSLLLCQCLDCWLAPLVRCFALNQQFNLVAPAAYRQLRPSCHFAASALSVCPPGTSATSIRLQADSCNVAAIRQRPTTILQDMAQPPPGYRCTAASGPPDKHAAALLPDTIEFSIPKYSQEYYTTMLCKRCEYVACIIIKTISLARQEGKAWPRRRVRRAPIGKGVLPPQP